jgi:hypothetical protein
LLLGKRGRGIRAVTNLKINKRERKNVRKTHTWLGNIEAYKKDLHENHHNPESDLIKINQAKEEKRELDEKLKLRLKEKIKSYVT